MTHDEVKAIVFSAAIRTTDACKNATGQHKAIEMYVSENLIANDVADAWCKAHPEQKAATTAPEYLRRAAEIMDERGKQYDSPDGERSMGRCVTAFNAITGRDLTEPEGWLLLQILKDVRQWSRPEYHRDSAEDNVAYAALKAEALERGAAKSTPQM